MPSYTGSCLCGAIQYKVNKMMPKMGHCHCRMCRKFHGAAFSTFGEAKKADFHWVKGKKFLKSYQAENGTIRQFCKNCGSSLIFQASHTSDEENETVEFSLGTLDDNIELKLKPDAHIFAGCKANWVEICDDLPQFYEDRSSCLIIK